VLRRLASTLGLTVSLAGLPIVLRAAAGPPTLAGLPSWVWLRDGVRGQYLPVDPILHALGLLAWSLWGYAVIVALLRVVAVLAARRRLVGAAALVALSNLVTLPPVRGLLDASIGVSLLASSSHATSTSTTFGAAPVAVVRTVQPQAAQGTGGWDRARPLLESTHNDVVSGESALASPDLPMVGPTVSPLAARSDPAPPARPAAGAPTRTYTVEDGDSLWRIAKRELGDGLRWREIWALNQGRDMGGGRMFRRAGLILPGWALYLPGNEQPAPVAPPPPPASPEHGGNASSPAVPTTAPSTTPPTTSAEPTTSTTAGSQGPPTSAPVADGRGHDVLELPSGAIVGVSLAGGIALALWLARARSRARRRLGQPLQQAPGAIEPEETTRRLDRFAHQRTSALVTLADDDEPDDQDQAPTGPPRLPLHAPVRLATWGTPYPARVPVAEHDGEEVPVDLVGHGVIAISGEHAADAARAAVVALLGVGNPFHVEVLVAGDGLLGALAAFPGLHRAATLADGLDHVERELVYRARVMDDQDTPDFATHREHNADEQPSALVLVTDEPPGEQAGRLAAVHQQGPRHGVGVLLVGIGLEPDLQHAGLEGVARVRLDEHGRVQAASPAGLSDPQLVGARMLRLGQAETVELLGVLAASRTEPTEPTEPPSAEPPATLPSIEVPAPPTPLPEPALHIEPPPAAQQAPVGVRLLGAYTIATTAQGEVRTGLRRTARELLAFALCHPDGFTAEQAIEALWPDGDPAKTPDWYWNAIANLRRVLARRTSTDKLASIVRDGARYRPERTTFEVDLWRVEAALAAARHAEGDQQVMAALGELAACYSGGLLADADYEWARVPREELRRRAVDALARLAELRTAAGDRDGALAVLEQAIEADPTAEELYRRIMRLQAELGRLDAVRRTWHLLEERLDDLGLDPEPASERLRSDLLKPTRRPPRRPPVRPEPTLE
jgi:DNA-binding SARP family transcriptional activator